MPGCASWKAFHVFLNTATAVLLLLFLCLFCMSLCDSGQSKTKTKKIQSSSLFFSLDLLNLALRFSLRSLVTCLFIDLYMAIHLKNIGLSFIVSIAIGRHAAVHVKFDHNPIVHTCSNIKARASMWCLLQLELELALNWHLFVFLCFVFFFFFLYDHSLLSRWRLRSCSSVSIRRTDGCLSSTSLCFSSDKTNIPCAMCFSGRATLMQITKTRMWGKGIQTRSWRGTTSMFELLAVGYHSTKCLHI